MKWKLPTDLSLGNFNWQSREGVTGLEIIFALLIIAMVVGLIVLLGAFHSSNAVAECPTTGIIWVGLDPESPLPASDSVIFVCAGEEYGLQWETEHADTVTVSGIADVTHDGSRQLTAASTIAFTLNAIGEECDVTDAARVQVLETGEELVKYLAPPSNQLITEQSNLHWVAAFDARLYSNSIEVGQVSLMESWLLQNCSWPSWEFKIVSPEGETNAFSIDSGSTSAQLPEGTKLVGEWFATPKGIPSDDDRIGIIAACKMEIAITLRCSR